MPPAVETLAYGVSKLKINRSPSGSVAASVTVMLALFLAKAPLAWPWYVPAGVVITLAVGFAGGALRPHREGTA